MAEVSAGVVQLIAQHAAECAPRECCGLIIVVRGKQRYYPCRNVAPHQGQFIIHPEDWVGAEDTGEVVAVVHSHVFEAPIPSQPDLVVMESTKLPWMIINHPTGEWTWNEPTGYKAPLVGRVFAEGVLDCLTLVQDFYQERYGITLPDERRYLGWEHDASLIVDLYQRKFGFYAISPSEVSEGDVAAMMIGGLVTNHLGIVLNSGHLLHHARGRLSSRDVFGDYWRDRVTMYLRHKDKP